MPLSLCLDCGNQISDAAFVCPACGRPHESPLVARLAAYVGPNWKSHYRGQFQRLLAAERTGPKAGWTWNWSAALTPFWFLYRRLYGHFCAFLALHLMMWIFAAAVAASAGEGSDDANPAGLFILILFLVQGYRADRLLFDKARTAVRDAGERHDAEWLAGQGKPLAWVPLAPLGLVVAGIIVAAMTAPPSSEANSYREPAAAVVADEPPPIVPNPVVFASIGGEIQVTAPGSWHTFQDLSEDAELQVGNARDDHFFLASTESKADLSSRVTLEQYDDASVAHLRKALTDDTLSAPRVLTIQGHSAIQHVVRGSYGHNRLVYWITTIETPRNFYRVFAWTRVSRAAAAEPVMQEVIESFRENP
jgi:hypothetical protein